MQINLYIWKADNWLPRNKVGGGSEGWIAKEHRMLWEVIDIFIILIIAMVSWLYTYVRTHQFVLLNMYS